MKKLMFLTTMFGLMIAFTVSVSAQMTKVGNGRVLNFSMEASVPKVGDLVILTTERSNAEYGLIGGNKYTRLKLDQGDRGQMYVYYLVDSPQVREQINNKNSKISVVCGGSKPWAPDDKVIIQTHPIKDGGTEVRFSVHDKGCFTFIVK